MDIRVLRYFLAVAREESISRAADTLHVTQPTLSRQLRDLEDELGVTLMLRGSRNITLTGEGMHLRRRAQEIVELTDRTSSEFTTASSQLTGDIHIGGGETRAMKLVADTAVQLHAAYPGVRFHLYSGNAEDVGEKLSGGLLDFGVFIQPSDLKKFDHIRLPQRDTWGLLLRRDHPLAQRADVHPEHLLSLPLLVSRQGTVEGELSAWLGESISRLDVVGDYNLINNAAVMVEAGLGCALTLSGLVNTCGPNSTLTFRPLSPRLDASIDLAWKKYQALPAAAARFLQNLQERMGTEAGRDALKA